MRRSILFLLSAALGSCGSHSEPATPADAGDAGFQVATISDTSVAAQLKVDGQAAYFSEATRDRISTVALMGGSVTVLATPQGLVETPFGPGEIALDPVNVYFLDSGGLESVPRSGGATRTLAAMSSTWFASGLVIHDEDLYWMAGPPGTTTDLYHLAATPGSQAEVVAHAVPSAAYAAVDASNCYWVTEDASSVNRMPRTGGPVTVLATPPSMPQYPDTLVAGGLAVDAQYVYWTVHPSCTAPAGTQCPPLPDASASIDRVPIGGGNVQVLATDSAAGGIAVDAKNVYWVNPNQSIKWLPVGGDASFPHGRVLVADDLAYLGPVLNGRALYWASGNGLAWSIKGIQAP